MPELPEVETVRRGLQPVLEGHRIVRAETRRLDLRVPFPANFAARLKGRQVTRLWRRAKYLLAEMDNGETLVIHLGMSGRMSVHTPATRPELGVHGLEIVREVASSSHDHVVIETDAPAQIVFTDPRRFGLMILIETKLLGAHPLLASLGPEPLSKKLNPAYLDTAFKKKRTPIKSALLDQRVIAGVGNIYACEALFRAGVSPKRLAINVHLKSLDALAISIKAVLREAIAAGGSSLRDHKRVNGELGNFQHNFAVYGREGQPCPAGCGSGSTIKRIVQAGRSTFYCPRCQK
jgi:formamidopyrimidine-DNA glycosylase